MAKKLECVMEGCHATIEDDSEDAVMEQVEVHASDVHPELDLNEETVENIRSSIQDV